jgi:predicted DNA-binding helix-hairpin-helix protein
MRNAKRIAELRRLRAVRYQDLVRLRCAMDTVKPFVVVQDYRPALADPTSEQLRRALSPLQPMQQQLALL